MLNIVIADDEAPARKRLRKLLSESVHASELHIVAEAKDGVDTLKVLSDNSVDVLFLDIQMPGYDGFEVLDRLNPDKRPAVIFTTAFDEYAIRAFDENAVDYLLKPIPVDRLDMALARAIERKPAQKSLDNIARVLDWMDSQAFEKAAESILKSSTEDSQHQTANSAPPAHYLDQMSIPFRDRILIIPVGRIVSIEINEGITRVHILEEESAAFGGPGGPRPKIRQHIVSYTLDQLGALLNPDSFMRIHRSAIVQFKHIKELIPWFSGRYKLILSGNHEVIASRERSKVLKDKLMI
jgi:two-component system, LytTR family, response regulator